MTGRSGQLCLLLPRPRFYLKVAYALGFLRYSFHSNGNLTIIESSEKEAVQLP